MTYKIRLFRGLIPKIAERYHQTVDAYYRLYGYHHCSDCKQLGANRAEFCFYDDGVTRKICLGCMSVYAEDFYLNGCASTY